MAGTECREHAEASSARGMAPAESASMHCRTDLMERIVDKDNMREAYAKVRSNRGSAGADRMGVSEMHDYFKEHADELFEQVLTVFGNGFLDILAARFRQSGKRTADVSDFCLPEHQGLVHPLARAVELDESSMVDHPVDHRGGKLVVAQDRSPFAELDVGGEHHASLLVAC